MDFLNLPLAQVCDLCQLQQARYQVLIFIFQRHGLQIRASGASGTTGWSIRLSTPSDLWLRNTTGKAVKERITNPKNSVGGIKK